MNTQESVWSHAKSEIRCAGGVVTARHPLSARSGIEMLRSGGNAVDAAVAASLAGSVVQQVANSIGGGGVAVVFHPTKGRATINYLYEAPGAATPDMFPLEPHAAPGLFGWTGIRNQLNEIGGLAVGVPGSIAGLHRTWERFGKLPWAHVIAPAIRLADEGFPMDWYGTLMLAVHADQMQAYPVTARQFLRAGVHAYRPAVIDRPDVFRQPALAATLRAIATAGPSAFYGGAVADSIVQAVGAAGGILRHDDLEQYTVRADQPATVSYRGHAVDYVACGAPTVATFLAILQHFEIASYAPRDPRRLHLIAEALRRAWHYRDRFNGDRPFVDSPWDGMVAAEFTRTLAASIDPDRRTAVDPSIDPHEYQPTQCSDLGSAKAGRHEGTVHISAADRDGCMVALTETVVGNFGSLVTSEAGVLLNNGMIAFSPIPGQRNSVAPRKRPATNMSPLIVRAPDGRATLTLGASGGRKIIPAILQVLSLVVDHGLGIQDAIAHPRLDLEGDKLILDARLGPEIAAGLERLGHAVELREEGLSTFEFGNACGILADGHGMLHSGVNPFQMTTAVGF